MLRFIGELRLNEGLTIVFLHVVVNTAMIVLAGLYRVYDLQFAELEVDPSGFASLFKNNVRMTFFGKPTERKKKKAS